MAQAVDTTSLPTAVNDIPQIELSADLFRQAFEAFPLPWALASAPEGRIVAANRAFGAVFGRDVRGDLLDDVVVLAGPADTSAAIVDVISGPEVAPVGVAVVPKDSSDAAAAEPGAGRASDNYVWRVSQCGGLLCLAGSYYITREETSELRRTEKRLAAILHDTVDGVITIDTVGNILSFNDAAERIFGHKREEVFGKNVSILMPSPHRDEHDDYIQNYRRTGVARIIGIGREVVGLRKDGSRFPMELAVSEVSVEGVTTFTGLIRDITHRRELEREILRIGDEERRRIGQDLHDELGQMLTGIGLMSQQVSRRLADREASESADVEQITRFIREADEYARTLARGLVPVELDGNGLPAALMRLAENASTLFGIKCTFHKTGPVQLPDPTHGMHLYRIAQEAISNAARHGNASRVRIELSENESRIRLRIEDDGAGFETDWKTKGGSGVRIMKYRANIIGGLLDISDTVSGSTVVSCSLPLNK